MNELSFSDLNLSEGMLATISGLGFEAPTSIQAECIPAIMQGRDVVGQAQTGTGKTAAFGVPALEKLDPNSHDVQVIIQCPTRELAIQVTGELMKLGRHIKKLNVVPIYGGQHISHQLKALKRGAQIVVGTPGRTIDHLKRGTLKLDKLSMVIFDEADEMLNMGFREDMEEIFTYKTGPVQTVMFSATVPKPIREIMKRYMNDPLNVTIDRQVMTAPDIKQYVVEVRDSMRSEAISRLMDVNNYKLALAFCNTKRKTEELASDLQSRGYSSEIINGDLSQVQRDRVMAQYRRGDIDILIATDVAARGIDVENVDVVFNYDIPQDPEYYVHRIGRTGRAGKSGTAYTFSAGRKSRNLHFIERQIRQQLEPMAMPSVADVEESRLAIHLADLTKTLEEGGLKKFIDQIEALSEGPYTTAEIAAALLKMRLGTQEKADVMQTVERPDYSDNRGGYDRGGYGKSRDRGDRGDRPDRGGKPSAGRRPARGEREAGMVKVQFSVGRKDKVSPGDLVGAIAGETGIPGKAIGHIDIQTNYSFVDIPEEYVPTVLAGMKKAQVKGNRVKVKVD
jgi:ATP-dependent RNA helicase DeaD